MMAKNLKEMAHAVRLALLERNLMDTRIDARDPGDLDKDDLDMARTFAAGSEEVLSKRVIVAVATDKGRGSVVIYTNRPYIKRDQAIITKGLDDNLPIIFRSLELGVQGPNNNPIMGLSMPVLRKKRTTCGSSISLGNDRGAGTLGALVRDAEGNLFGLSCSHVIAGCGYMQVGMPIVSPGIQDVVPGWPDPRVIGHFERALPLVAGDPRTIGALANLDAGVFRLSSEKLVSSMQGGEFDTPSEIHDLSENDEGELQIEKVGRTTGHTEGTVLSEFDHPIEVAFSVVTYPEHGQLKKFEATVYTNALWMAGSTGRPFANPGDSGALVVTRSIDGAERKAVGLVIAGTKDHSALVLPIRPILEALNVSLVSTHGV